MTVAEFLWGREDDLACLDTALPATNGTFNELFKEVPVEKQQL
jgi:hypothetical protein